MGKKKTANSRGREAFNNGDPFDSNPHKMGELDRLYWFQGWLDEWGDGSGGWEVERGMGPKNIGSVWLGVTLTRSKADVYRLNLEAVRAK
jgi:hypothetical protein